MDWLFYMAVTELMLRCHFHDLQYLTERSTRQQSADDGGLSSPSPDAVTTPPTSNQPNEQRIGTPQTTIMSIYDIPDTATHTAERYAAAIIPDHDPPDSLKRGSHQLLQMALHICQVFLHSERTSRTNSACESSSES